MECLSGEGIDFDIGLEVFESVVVSFLRGFDLLARALISIFLKGQRK